MKLRILLLLFLVFSLLSAAETPTLILAAVKTYPAKVKLKEPGRWIRISDENYLFLPSDSPRITVRSFQKVVIQDTRSPKIFAVPSGKSQLLETSAIFYLHPEDAKRFYELTKKCAGQKIGCFINETFFCAPLVLAPISGGKAQIIGDFNDEQMKLLRQIEKQKK